MFRTGLTIEAAEYLTGVSGTKIAKRRFGGAMITDVKLCENGAAKIGKTAGRYITIEGDPAEHSVQAVLEKALEQLIPRRGVILAAGLGNPDIARDSLGSKTVCGIVPRSGARHSIAAVETDITAKTGIETACMVKALARELNASCVVAVDALACKDPHKIGRTVQLSDTGIQPASGVRSDGKALTAELVGVPVISVGVPMVAQLSAITGDSTHNGYLAAPADEDILSALWAEAIAGAINSQAL